MSFFTLDDKKFEYDLSCIAQESLTITASQSSYTVARTTTLDLSAYAMLVIDEQVYALYQASILFPKEKIFFITASEENKSLETVQALLHVFQQQHLLKSDLIAVIGGGVTQEIAAFACCLYKRGMAYHHFPTTLLAMADSCIGGKAGLNFAGAKNQLGVFYPPAKVLLYFDFLSSLPEREILSGLGEVLKACVVLGEAALTLYQENINAAKAKSIEALATLVFTALLFKKIIVEADEFEKKERAVLNYGHSLGHAIEAASKYEISHGQSVALGMLLENHVSYQLGILSQTQFMRIQSLGSVLLDKKVATCLQNMAVAQLIAHLKRDKKVSGAALHLYLLKQPGDLLRHVFTLSNASFQALFEAALLAFHEALGC